MGTVNINTRDGEDILEWLVRCADQFSANVDDKAPNPYRIAANELRALRLMVDRKMKS